MNKEKIELGDAPIDREYHDLMNKLAKGLDDIFNGDERPRQTGFVLMVFPFGEHEGARCNYISNANRADVMVMMREQLARFEGAPDQTGRA